MNAMWQLWWFISHKSAALVVYIFRSLHKKHFSANTPQVLLPPCSRTEGQVRWKKEHALWMLSRCLQSSLYSQRTLYSCINAFQDAGTWFTARLMDCFPPFPRRVVYILTLVSEEANRSCWIGYLPLPQGHTQQHVCFSSDDFEKQCPIKCLICIF